MHRGFQAQENSFVILATAWTQATLPSQGCSELTRAAVPKNKMPLLGGDSQTYQVYITEFVQPEVVDGSRSLLEVVLHKPFIGCMDRLR